MRCKKPIVILLLVLLILLVPTVLADATRYSSEEIADAALILWYPSVNVTNDNSTEGRTCTLADSTAIVLNTTTNKVGSAAGYFKGTTDACQFDADPHMNEALNQTICTVTTWDGVLGAGVQHVAARTNGVAAEGDWRIALLKQDPFNVQFAYYGSSGLSLNVYNFFANYGNTDEGYLLCGIINVTGTTVTIYILVNDTVIGEVSQGGITPTASDDHFTIGDNGADNSQVFTGQMEDIYYINKSLSSDDISEHIFNGGDFLKLVRTEVTPPSPFKTFTLTAKDLYDETALKNITVTITNVSSDFSFNASTVNGTIHLDNSSIPAFDGLYQLDIQVNDTTKGYFNRTFLDVNITDGNSMAAGVFQSVISLTIVDGLNNQTINEFTAATNLSTNSTTNGLLLLLITEGVFNLSITADGFDTLLSNFSIEALQNNTINLSMGSIFAFNLIRESTNEVFDFNGTNLTTLNIFCPNQTIQLFFNTSSNITRIINCQFTLMQMVVDYGPLGSYFRTLIPPFSQKNITWYLIDVIAGDTAIQRVITLLDLTGEFANSILTVQRSIAGTVRTMIEQRFDISNQVNLFLVKDSLYSISIDNGVQDIVLGNLIPTEAGTQTITLPKIDFVPQETILGENISWSYNFNITANILRLQYEDITNRTTLVRFTVFNDTGETGLSQLFVAESDNNSSVTMTFNQAFANNTYVTELFVKHLDLGNFTDKNIFYQFKGSGVIDLIGWTPIEQTNIKKWGAWIFLGAWGLLFTRRYMGIGMTSLIIFLWLFRQWNWIEVPNLIFGFVTLLVVVGWLVDAMRRN